MNIGLILKKVFVNKLIEINLVLVTYAWFKTITFYFINLPSSFTIKLAFLACNYLLRIILNVFLIYIFLITKLSLNYYKYIYDVYVINFISTEKRST